MNDQGVLYIIATPIGNLDDITYRAVATLKMVDFVAAEDTRHSQRLMNHLGIEVKFKTYHDHSSEKQIENLLDLLLAGSSVGLISDAGTPLVSDPGYRIVKLARERGINVVPVPGVSAPITALCAAGLATDRFSFEGFLPHKSGARCKRFEQVKDASGTSVFFESPHRIADAVEDAISVFGEERPAVLARELTKSFETFLGSTLGDIQQAQTEDPNQSRGELVLMIGTGSGPSDAEEKLTPDARQLIEVLAEELPTKQAAALAAKISGQPKKRLYEYAVEIKNR